MKRQHRDWQLNKDKLLGNLKYAVLNGRGELTSDIRSVSTHVLSDVQQVVQGNKIIWFTRDMKKKVMYELEIE
ncbi:hypothetical protein LZ480_13850 [Solibacillus sp. MA9]|uniref:DUF2642 domain-containing protein n=1 Tax=Solibacillus palustris TaxID=2908203 RepID=A0ABS9UG78_9BACL|nr:hypothetical protein [Solibacillus sp. MA9]MCH7322958.1 hypothetical protein [Solibacillus sp. MA9]